MEKVFYGWDWFDRATLYLAAATERDGRVLSVYGIPRGGLFLATRLSYLLDVPLIQDRRQIGPLTLIADDIADSGTTLHDLFSLLPPGQPRRVAVLELAARSSFIPAYHYQMKAEGIWSVYPWEAGAESDTVSKVRP